MAKDGVFEYLVTKLIIVL